MKFARFFKQLFIWTLVLQVLNNSVDSPELLPAFLPENLAYNEQESIAEILFEKVFKQGNLISEHDEDESDEEGMGLKKMIDRISILKHKRLLLHLLPESTTLVLASKQAVWKMPDLKGVLQPPKR